MGLISRASGEPYEDGETLPGPELEGDIAGVYNLVNGNIDAANLADEAVTAAKLADDAVTTVKIDDEAVTQAKLADGAATMSEDSLAGLAAAITSTSYATLGSAISHAVSSDPRHVIIFASMRLRNDNNVIRTFTFKVQKDGVDLLASNFDENVTLALSAETSITRMWVDDSPTPSATHSYRVQGKVAGGQVTYHNLHLLVLEPRR